MNQPKVTKTLSGKHVVLLYTCPVTNTKHGFWIDRNGNKVPSTWQPNNQWIKGIFSSMDLI